MYYTDGSGFGIYNGPSLAASTSLGPAVGVKWWIKIDVTYSGANVTFTCKYATAGTSGPWTSLLSYTASGVTCTPNVGPVINPNGGGTATATAGTHIGNLLVRDIPIVPVHLFNCGRAK